MANALFNTTKKLSYLNQAWKYFHALAQAGAINRVMGTKPIWAQLKITERCNLQCGYCSEHKNNGRHVPVETVFEWIGHCYTLGIRHVEFIGGEPLLHPALMHMVKRARSLKMNTGLTTNGFLLNENTAENLFNSGINRFQLSIDCIEPTSVTRKAFNLLRTQLEILQRLKIWAYVSCVITRETLLQAYELAEALFTMKIPVAFNPVHDHGQLRIDREYYAVIKFFDWLIEKKDQGFKVNMPRFLINYYKNKIAGHHVPWTCVGGYKAFYVDSKGGFRVCSHMPSERKLKHINNRVLRDYRGKKKGCEQMCGVSCMIINSFPYSRLNDVICSDLLPRFGAGKKGLAQ